MPKTFIYWRDKAVERFDEIWPILAMRDMRTVHDVTENMAFNKHVELLKKNMPDALYGKRVKPIREIKNGYMKGFNVFHAAAIAKILGTIKEGETRQFMNIRFRKEEGKIRLDTCVLKEV